MSVIGQTSSPSTYGVLLVGGVIAGGLTAYFVDGLPDFALPAAGLVAIAIITYLENREV